MSARWWTWGVWALAAGSAAFWGLKVFVKPPAAPAHTQTAAAAQPLRGDLSRLLGSDPPPPVATATPEPLASARFQLVGVVSAPAQAAAREGLALIAIDGKPARAYRVGTVIDGDQVLQSVAARGVTIGPRQGAATVALNLPPIAAPATGTLPSLTPAPGAAAVPAALPAPAAGALRPARGPRSFVAEVPGQPRRPGLPLQEAEPQDGQPANATR